MPFPVEIRRKVGRALAERIPFALYRRPGRGVCFVTDDRAAVFAINAWNTDSSENIVIGRPAAPHAMPVPAESTRSEDYVDSLHEVIARLRRRGGKTVISRVITGDASRTDWTEAAERLFDEFGDAFCHLYYTPQTGAWMGATPELLLDVTGDGRMSTMALAGTMPVGGEWDDKNRNEHRMVVDFIAGALSRLGANPSVSETGSLRYGSIKHLYTPVSAVLPADRSVSEVLDMLSPTPAVAGCPRREALRDIAEHERHSRGCYAGYIAVTDSEGIHAYVNLRCVQFDTQGRYCVYAGGGITAGSVPETEWVETEAKSKSILSIINKSTK